MRVVMVLFGDAHLANRSFAGWVKRRRHPSTGVVACRPRRQGNLYTRGGQNARLPGLGGEPVRDLFHPVFHSEVKPPRPFHAARGDRRAISTRSPGRAVKEVLNRADAGRQSVGRK